MIASFARSLLLLASLLFAPAWLAAQPAWSTLVVGSQSEPERLATIDLQRYLAQASGKLLALKTVEQWRKQPEPAVILGTLTGNPLLKGQDLGAASGKPEGYLLANATLEKQPVVVVAGADGPGAVQGVYGLLRELGFGFFLGSETVPASVPERLPGDRIVKVPALGIRGVLPWYNFFNSPTTWDPVDHRAFVDQLIRSGANFVGFHTYDAEPFAGVIEGDKVIGGARLLSTATRTWGTIPTKTADFGFGTGNLYAQEYFGAATTELPGPVAQVVKREQDILRDALNYAKARGLRACIGFEVHRNPMNPDESAAFLKRFNHVLDQYPGADFIWLWQPETQGAKGYAPADADKDPFFGVLRSFGGERREIFKRVVDEAEGIPPFFEKTEQGRINRAMEGARLEQYGMLAWRALQRREAAPRLVISGWGGDRRILSAEYYEGLDRLLPKDVVFSSLDLIGPIRRVDKIYGALPADRQRWPIPWLENDGDQWMPQPFVDIYQDLMKDLIDGGSQGVLGIHWRSRCIEENLQFLVDCAWNPGLRAEAFYKEFARRRYGTAIAEPMAEVHLKLDRLPYRWIGGVGQVECAEFSWGAVGKESDALALQALREQCAGLLPNAGAGREQLSWLLARMDYVLAYRQAQADYLAAEKLAATQPKAALDILDRGALAKALQAYATRLTTRGEYGVLATINSKAVVSWNQLRKKCMAAAGERPDPSANWSPTPGVLVPRLIGSATVGQELPLEAIVLGGGNAYLHYRPLGAKTWNTLPLQTAQRWVKRATVPAAALVAPGIEIAVSLDGKPEKGLAWGPRGVTVMPITTQFNNAKTTPAPGTIAPIPVKVGVGRETPIALQWPDVAGVDAFRVYREDQLVGVTAVPTFFDLPDRERGTYRVEAIRDGAVVASSAPAPFVLPDAPVEENPAMTLSPNNLGVLVTALPVQSSVPLKYRLYRSGTASQGAKGSQDKIFEHLAGQGKAPGAEQLLAEMPASRSKPMRHFDPVPQGTWTYRLELMNLFGRKSPQPESGTVAFRPEPVAPALELPLTTLPAGATVSGDATFTPAGLTVSEGHVDLPHADWMNLTQALTVRFSFTMNAPAPMPVLVSHGVFNSDGWFVQIQGGRLSVRLPGAQVPGPVIKQGEPYEVIFVFDGKRAHLAVNGAWTHVDTLDLDKPTPNRPLRLGQYQGIGPDFQFKGVIRDLRMYPGIPEEVAAQCAGTQQ